MNVQNGYCDFHTYFNKVVENKNCLSKSTMEQFINFLQHQTLILSQEKNGALKGNDWTQMKTVIDSEIEDIKKKELESPKLAEIIKVKNRVERKSLFIFKQEDFNGLTQKYATAKKQHEKNKEEAEKIEQEMKKQKKRVTFDPHLPPDKNLSENGLKFAAELKKKLINDPVLKNFMLEYGNFVLERFSAIFESLLQACHDTKDEENLKKLLEDFNKKTQEVVSEKMEKETEKINRDELKDFELIRVKIKLQTLKATFELMIDNSVKIIKEKIFEEIF